MQFKDSSLGYRGPVSLEKPSRDRRQLHLGRSIVQWEREPFAIIPIEHQRFVWIVQGKPYICARQKHVWPIFRKLRKEGKFWSGEQVPVQVHRGMDRDLNRRAKHHRKWGRALARYRMWWEAEHRMLGLLWDPASHPGDLVSQRCFPKKFNILKWSNLDRRPGPGQALLGVRCREKPGWDWGVNHAAVLAQPIISGQEELGDPRGRGRIERKADDMVEPARWGGRFMGGVEGLLHGACLPWPPPGSWAHGKDKTVSVA